jgi:hypothetical protein
MIKHTLPSGAELEITPLPWEEAWGISRICAKIVETFKLDLKGIDFKAIGAMDVMQLQGPICTVIASKEVIEAAKTCFKRCTYNGLKIDAMTFESQEARGDFIPCVALTIKENIAPFFGGLLSFLNKI